MNYIATRDNWLRFREQGLCDFTDEELERAIEERVPIRTGQVKYIGNDVRMLIAREGK